MAGNRLFSLLIALFLAGCATLPPDGRRALEGQDNDLVSLCRRHNITWQWDTLSKVVTLNKSGHRVKAMDGSFVAMVNGETILLSAPLKVVRGRLTVPYDFQRKVIFPLIQDLSGVHKKFRTIVIDAGHGGKDPGAIGRTGTQEKSIVLDIAKRLRRSFQKEGIEVIMTRKRDKFISLQGRTVMASQTRADLFLSIHANASPSARARGLEIYYLRPAGFLMEDSPQAKKNFNRLTKRFKMKHTSPTLQDTLLDMMFVHKQNESRQLADFITQRLDRDIEVRNHGSKSAGFFVLKNTLIPAILVEVGFLTNAREEKLLNTNEYRQKLADKLVKTILDYSYAR